MPMRILWPNLPAQLIPIATEAVGPGFELEFHAKFEDVPDDEWDQNLEAAHTVKRMLASIP